MFIEEKEKSELLERFLRYVKIWSTSDSERADSGVQPSTDRQFDFARVLAEELKANGAEGVQVTDKCYVYGFLPASESAVEEEPLCFLAHMDTVEEVSGKNVRPQVHEHYNGEKIVLEGGIVLSPETDEELSLSAKNRETIITSDGTTLLGADDKAGVAAIMSAVSFLNSHKELKRRKIEIIFSPDEETGHGMDNVPLGLIQSKAAYTVDGGHIGELEAECFNAFKSEIVFEGKSKHTGNARPDMVNAILMAANFVQNLPAGQRPETTDGKMGFFAPMAIEGSIEKAKLTLFLRDFSKDGMEKRKSLVDTLARTTQALFGGKVSVTHTFQYANMKEELDKNPLVTERLVSAYKAAGVEPICVPIRGGTDGSRLTELGIPTPNIFTGGHNYHSRTEWCSLEQMAKAEEVLLRLMLAE